MGGFGGKTVVQVGTSAMHLADASATPLADSIHAAIFQSGVPWATQENITSYIIKTGLNGIANKIRWAHQYARDHYALQLPAGQTRQANPINYVELVPYIVAATGYTDGVIVSRYAVGELSPKIMLYEYLWNNLGYNDTTDIITIYPATLDFTNFFTSIASSSLTQVKLHSIELSVDKLHAIINYELWAELPVVVGIREEREIVLQWIKATELFTETVAIPGATGLTDWYSDCLYVGYQQLDALGVTINTQRVWIYVYSDNLYPELHPTDALTVDEFLPVIPMRFNNVDLADPTTQNNPPDPTNLYSTSKVLLQKLGVNFQDMGARLNANPDIASMDNAYIMFGVDIQTNQSESLFYLSEYFDDLRLSQVSTEGVFLANLADPTITYEATSRFFLNRQGQTFKNTSTAFSEYGLILELAYDYISSQDIFGIIGNGQIGQTIKELVPYSVTINITRQTSEGEQYTDSWVETRYKLVLKSQVSSTLYREVAVSNLKMVNWVYGTKSVITTLENIVTNPDDHSLIIPIQYNLADQYNLIFRNALYTESIMMVINTIDFVKLKWYQTSWFRAIVMAIVMIIVAYTGQAYLMEWVAGLQGAMYGVAATATTAAIAGGVIPTLVYLGTSIALSYAIGFAADIIIKYLGEKFGIIGAIVAMVIAAVMIARGGGFGNLSKSLLSTTQYIIQGSTALVSSANEFLIEEGAKIRNEYDRFVEKLDGLWEELDIINDLLQWKSDIDPLIFTKPSRFRVVPNETPTIFFARCLGLSENTMHTIHSEIPNFIDARLRLDATISPEMYGMNSYS